MQKEKPILTLFLTENMSLREWDRLGLINREMAIYEKLMVDFSIQIFSYGNVADLAYEKKYADLKVLIIPYYKRNLTLKNRWHLFKAESALRKSDILKTNQIKGSHLAVSYSQKFEIPLVTRCGYLFSTFTEKQSTNKSIIENAYKLEKEAFEQASVGFTSSERDRDFVIKTHKIPAKKMIVLPNYVDTQIFSFSNSERNEGEILFIGRLSEQKNLFALLDAFDKSIHAKKLILIGQGEHESALKEKATKINKPILFLGALPNSELPTYLHQASLYILPSFYEGLPKTLLEAMSTGISCIGTDVEGIREVIKHEENGILCSTEVDSISQALDRVLSDKTLALRLGNSARNTIVETYSLKKVAELESSVYKSLIKET